MVSRTLMKIIDPSRSAHRRVWLVACLVLLASLVMGASALVPIIEWQKAMGGTDNDYAYAVNETTDGGYIIAGNTFSVNGNVVGNHGDSDMWVVKLDAARNIQWQVPLGGTNEDYAYSVRQTSDGGYIVAGETRSTDGQVTGNHGSNDAWIVKLDATGAITWQKALGGSNYDYASDVQQTTDGGYIVAASSESTNGQVTGNHGLNDFWIVKLDTLGNLVWQKAYGGTDNDYAYAIQQTTDGGYIVAGETNSTNGNVTGNHGLSDFWITKLDTLGNLVWQKAYGSNKTDFATSVQQTADGGYIVAGESGANNGNVLVSYGQGDYWVLKLNNLGAITWQKTLGGSRPDHAYSIKQIADLGYVVVGGTESSDGWVVDHIGAMDFFAMKLNSAGVYEWRKSLGGSDYDHPYSIIQTKDTGFVMAGESFSNNGNVTGNHGNNDQWVVKFEPIGLGWVVPNFVNATTTPLTGKSPLTVQFIDTTTNVPGHWNWTFGDGTFSNLQNPVHVFTNTTLASKSFTVTLNTGNTFGDRRITKINYVTVTP